MFIDLAKETHLTRLDKAIKHSTRALRPFRDNRSKLIKDYVGSQYGSQNYDRQEIIQNLMYQTAETYTMALAANRPRCLITSLHPELTWFANQFQVAINNLIKEIKLEETLRAAVLDAFFSVGIVKVFTAEAGAVQLGDEDEWVDPGKPYAENISLDNFVFDMQATKWSQIRFALDKYHMPFEKARQDGSLDQKIVKDLLPSQDYSTWDDQSDEESVKELHGAEKAQDSITPRIQLMDVWLPANKQVATFAVNKMSKPLRVVDWAGPERGPFHKLSLTSDVPDNIMPLPPAMNLKGINDIINGLLRKQRAQAQRQKDIPFYQDGSQDDARRLQQASDGEWTRVGNPESVNVLKMGGVDQGNQAFYHMMQDMFDRMAGNLSLMAGLGPQSGTLGQDKMLHGAVNKREANMQYRVIRFVADICEDLGWLLWNDENMEIPGETEVAGIKFDRTWTPEQREGDFLQYNFDIEPFSMMYKSPSERMNNITQFLTQIALPMQPMMEQYGGQIDIQALTDIYADLMDMPRLRSIIMFEEPKEDRPGPTPEAPPQPAHTVRESVRKSVPTGGNDQSRSNVMQQILQGGQPNQQQMAQMGRERAG